MSFNFNGREILTDSEGYLKNREDWSEELMNYMANQDSLELTQEHILIIKAVKNYYEEYATTPAIRILIKYLKTSGHEDLASSIKLAVLFPDGAAKSAAKYAGLPKPVKCI
jgi:tRNA 2-thiouridine synthesizing protein E